MVFFIYDYAQGNKYMVLYFLLYMNKKKEQKEKYIKALGKRIKELRIKKGYNNYEYFAYDNDIARSQYGTYERGEDIKFSNLMRVIKALGVTPNEFFSKEFSKELMEDFPEENKK